MHLLRLIFNSGQQLCGLGRGEICNCEVNSFITCVEMHVVPSSGSEHVKRKVCSLPRVPSTSAGSCRTWGVGISGGKTGSIQRGQSSESACGLKGKWKLGRIKILLGIFAA